MALETAPNKKSCAITVRAVASRILNVRSSCIVIFEARAKTLSPKVDYEIWGYAEQTFSTEQILTLDKVYDKVLEVAFEYETLDHIKSFPALCIKIQKT